MNIWNKISYLGISDQSTNAEKRNNVLTNRLIFFTFVTLVIYIPILYFLDIQAPLFLSFLMPILFGTFFILSLKGKHQILVFLLLCVLTTYIVMLTTFEALMTAKLLSGIIHVFLIPIALFGVTLMKSIKSGIVSSVMILMAFIVTEIIKHNANYESIPPSPALLTLYIVDLITIVTAITYCIYHFKLISKDYSIDLVRQKIKLEAQHDTLTQAHANMQQSIEYAKKIQSAILPSDQLVKAYFKESFILYRPKDIVAGDFYWTQELENHILFAVADCTGHGVPGALVSVVCNNALNRAVREFNLSNTGEILDKTRKIVIKEFEKSEENVYDGMDIALIKMPLDFEPNQAVEIEFSGANNPLWIIRDNNLIEYKGDKQPIAKFHKPSPFKTTNITLKSNDNLYIFSDGFTDQFGGEKGKKFKHNPFRTLLLRINQLNMNDQRQHVKETFQNWKGRLEQVDDICVVGLKI